MVKPNKSRIENLALSYFEIRCGGPGDKDLLLSEAFTIYDPYIQHSSELASRSTGIDVCQFISIQNEKLWIALEKWRPDGGASFYTYIRKLHDRAIAKIIRDEKKKIDRDVFVHEALNESGEKEFNEFDEGLLQMSCNIDNMDIERELIRKDQRQLVESLVEHSGKSEPKIRPIVAIKLSDPDLSLEDIGDVLGESKQTVGNRLKSLEKVFSRHDFGKINDYYVA